MAYSEKYFHVEFDCGNRWFGFWRSFRLNLSDSTFEILNDVSLLVFYDYAVLPKRSPVDTRIPCISNGRYNTMYTYDTLSSLSVAPV